MPPFSFHFPYNYHFLAADLFLLNDFFASGVSTPPAEISKCRPYGKYRPGGLPIPYTLNAPWVGKGGLKLPLSMTRTPTLSEIERRASLLETIRAY